MARSKFSIAAFAFFLTATLTGRLARADDGSLDVSGMVAKAIQYVQENPITLFWATCAFLVIAIFAKARSASGSLVLGLFFFAAVSIFGFVVLEMIQQFDEQHRGNKLEQAASPLPPREKAEAEPPRRAEPKPGGPCKTNSDCSFGTVCSHVAGDAKCWAPCATGGTCATGFVCMASTEGPTVCAK
jgi:hypothetical protein